MTVRTTELDGVLVVDSGRIDDERGFFRQTFQAGEIESALGRPLRLRQGNHSRSKAGVLRGFHLEPWDKLAYVVRGTAFFAVADMRPASPTFGRTVTFTLGDEPGRFCRVFVPRGCANAFLCFSEVDYVNEVSEEFDPSDRRGVIWNDPELAVDWPVSAPILSATDRRLPTLARLFPRRGPA